MKQMPQLIAAIFLGAILGYLLASHQSTIEIGVVNMGLIVDESPKAKELNNQLTQRYDLLLAEIQAQREVLSEEALNEVERSAYATYLEYRQDLENQFQQALDRAISEVAEAEQIEIVLDEDVVRYGGKNLSAKVIRKLQ